MPLPKKFWELFTTDYTEVYRPPLNLPRNLTDEFHKVLISGDVVAIEKYYREEILPYCYSADLERAQVERWDWEKIVEGSRKSAEVRRKNAQDHYSEWQEEADMQWEKNPSLSKSDVAKNIVKGQKRQKEHDDSFKVYAVDTVRRKIRKK